MRRATYSLGLAGLLLALALALTISGCLERKETIRVARDGSVQMRVEWEGDPGDFSKGDTLPTQHTGWATEDEIVTDDEGKETARFCTNPDCDYTTEVEPDSSSGYCEICGTQTVQSCLVLAGMM